MYLVPAWYSSYKMNGFSKQVVQLEQNKSPKTINELFALASQIEEFGDKHTNTQAYQLADRLYEALSKKGNGRASYQQFQLSRDKLKQADSIYIPYLKVSAEQGFPQGQYKLAQYYYNESKENIGSKAKPFLQKSYDVLKLLEKKDSNMAHKLLRNEEYLQAIISIRLEEEDRKRAKSAVESAVETKKMFSAASSLVHHVKEVGQQVGAIGMLTQLCGVRTKDIRQLLPNVFKWKVEDSRLFKWESSTKEAGYTLHITVDGTFAIDGSLWKNSRHYVDIWYSLRDGTMRCLNRYNSSSKWSEICWELGGAFDNQLRYYRLPNFTSYNVPNMRTCTWPFNIWTDEPMPLGEY